MRPAVWETVALSTELQGLGMVRNVVKKLANTVCTVVRKATEACMAQKVLQNSLLDSAILKI